MASVFKAAANEEIKAQPWWVRYKASILITLAGVSWILQELVTAPEFADVRWGGLTFATVVNIVVFFINRFTKDGITPSMAGRLERAGMAAFQDRVSESGVYAFSEPDAAEDEPVEDAPRVIYVPLDQGADVPAAAVNDDAGEVELPTYTGESSAPDGGRHAKD